VVAADHGRHRSVAPQFLIEVDHGKTFLQREHRRFLGRAVLTETSAPYPGTVPSKPFGGLARHASGEFFVSLS